MTQAASDVALPKFSADSPNIYENSAEKLLGTPGSNSVVVFKLKSSRMAVGPTSRLVISFPKYYAADISRDGKISCYLDDDVEVFCQRIREWTLEVKYFYKTIAVNQPIVFSVVGVT